MHIIFGFMPIIIVVALVIIAVFIGLKVGRSKKTRGNKSLYILVGYGLLLVLSTILYFLVPVTAEDPTQKIDVTQIPNLSMEAYEGKLANVDEKYITQKWTFPFEGNQLNIEEYWGNGDVIDVYYGTRKNTNEIEVLLYETPLIIGESFDASKSLIAPKVSLEDDSLLIQHPDAGNIQLSQFKNEFPFRQFLKGSKGDLFYSADLDWDSDYYGDRVIYILVPARVQLESNVDEQ
ncbi:hypothetical protein [Virgibacillus sp. MG-45]|uniref:hypothetical protein n=1 Tax=Virgibacillus sp. MG-45 TaxID=3102791 RepID=UPI002ED9FAE8